MKAIVHSRFGPPAEVLHLTEVEKPVPGENEVLIKVRAASVNPLDWHFIRGTPYVGRIMFGFRKPKRTRPGVDVAGQVEAVGRNVSEFKPGDEVFGTCAGALAEYACAPESKLVMKPGDMTFEEAAAIPIAGVTALQGLRDKGKIQPGQKVLINGAAGGVGTFTVQIAKVFGAEVTGVCSTRNLNLVRSIGADQVIDYTQQDFTKSGEHYDLIFDCIGNHSLLAMRRVLKPKGIYLGVGGGPADRWLDPLPGLIAMLVLSPFVSQKLSTFLANVRKEDLTTLREMIQAGKIRPVIDRRYTLREAPQAIQHLEEGHARGKVVVTPVNDSPAC